MSAITACILKYINAKLDLSLEVYTMLKPEDQDEKWLATLCKIFEWTKESYFCKLFLLKLRININSKPKSCGWEDV